MTRRVGKIVSGIGAVGLLGLLLATGSAAVTSAQVSGAQVSTPHNLICSGGSLSANNPTVINGGSYQNIIVTGFCVIGPSGPVTVLGNVTVLGALDVGSAASLTVDNNVVIGTGAVINLGCGGRDGGPCEDGGAIGTPVIHGSVAAGGAAGVIVHNAEIDGSVTQTGGGGGFNCNPGPGPLSFGFFSAWEDSTIGGSLTISGVASCWMGIVNNSVGGSVTLTSNRLADPDAIEVMANTITKNLVCSGNSMVWDSYETGDLFPRVNVPNSVGGVRSGQCYRSTPTDSYSGAYGPPNSF